jgi:hypothetical protein
MRSITNMKKILFILILLISVQVSAANCPLDNLLLNNVTCNPPHGLGPDGRIWVKLVCSDGVSKVPLPYDWQLARFSFTSGDIFAWSNDPLYAYVEAPNGNFQAQAHTILGQLNINFTTPQTCS